MADSLHNLLMYIVEHPLLQDESREAQIDATAVQDVNAEIGKIGADQREDAQKLAPAFARGLRMAAKTRPLVVEDTTPEGNAIAEAFARFMVAPRLATSQSEPLPAGHFRYTFDIDWPRLRRIAQAAGIDLDGALAGDRSAG